MHDNAWTYVQALVEQDVTNGKELLEIQESWWEKNHFPLAHVAIIRAAIGNEEVRCGHLLRQIPMFANPAGMTTPATSTMSGGSADSAIVLSGLAVCKNS